MSAPLASMSRSEQHPQASIVTPTAAGFDGAVRWAWTDGDGDPLAAWIEYRRAPDALWQPLSIDIDDDRLIAAPDCGLGLLARDLAIG